MAFSSDSPSAAKGHDLASWVVVQLSGILATSQVNADVLLDVANLDAILDLVIASVGS